MSKIRVSHIEKYIRHVLPPIVQRDLRNKWMVRESDLESSIYFHLRKYLKPDSLWRVFARKHVETGHYIDILVFKRTTPRIAIELKWNKSKINDKDHSSLKRAITELNVNRSYFISTITHGPLSWEHPKPFKRSIEPRNILAIFIPLGLSKEKNSEWNEQKRIYTSKMSKGKARHNGAS